MFPSRSAMDYNMTEMNRIFSVNENDLFHSLRTPSSSGSFSHSILQSSSSTETSPESYPDFTHRYDLRPDDGTAALNFELQASQQSHTFQNTYENLFTKPVYYDTKFQETPIRKLRPIVGRKVIEEPKEVWQPDVWRDDNISKTPPKQVYELFPTDKEYRSPIKSVYSSSPMSPIRNPSPMNKSIISPERSLNPFIMQNRSLENAQMLTNSPPTPLFMNLQTQAQFKEPIMRMPQKIDNTKICTFCRKNGEAPVVFTSHVVKTKVGNKHVVTCPILRSLVCSTCGASGDNAHTITYCPVLRNNNNGQPLRSTTITLKNTRVKSNGRRRY